MKVLTFAKEILIPAVGKLLCHIYGRHAWPPMTITSHTCAYNIILKANREYTCGMWSYYNANYRQKAEATLNKDWSAIDTSLFSQCFTGRARKALSCINCSSLKHDSAECPHKKGNRPANKDNKGQMYASTGTYNRPCHTTPCHYKHECIKCFPEEHSYMDFPKMLKRDTLKKTDH